MNGNRVMIYAQDGYVQKEFRSTVAFDKERLILESLRRTGLTPEPFSFGKNSLRREYIAGVDFSERLEHPSQYVEDDFTHLLEWIVEFSVRTREILHQTVALQDLRLHSFVLCRETGHVTGIRFEAWEYGTLEENLASLLAAVQACELPELDVAQEIFHRLYTEIEDLRDVNLREVAFYLRQKQERLGLWHDAMKRLWSSTAVILMGGKSSRMRQPKELLCDRGYPFWEHILYELSCFDKVFLSVAHDAVHPFYGIETVADHSGDLGPISGICAALSHADTEYVFFVPCDTPFMTTELMLYLYARLDGEDCVIAAADGRAFPLVGIYKRSILPVVTEQIGRGDYKIMNLLDLIKTRCVNLPERFSGQLENINTPEQYRALCPAADLA